MQLGERPCLEWNERMEVKAKTLGSGSWWRRRLAERRSSESA